MLFELHKLSQSRGDKDQAKELLESLHQGDLRAVQWFSRYFQVAPENRDRFAAEVKYMLDRWGDVLRTDPYYNPNLSLDATDFSLAGTPRVTRPWRAYRRSGAFSREPDSTVGFALRDLSRRTLKIR